PRSTFGLRLPPTAPLTPTDADDAHASESSPPPAGGGIHISAENVNHAARHGDFGIQILHGSVALEALYDSAESFPQPKCHPETRAEILDGLWHWAIKTDSVAPIRWLYGPGGAGKSAIMQTLCQRLQTAGLLAGSFFFKRGHPTRGNATLLFATLAYQLAIHNRTLKSLISETVEQDPSIVRRSMASQLRELMIRPCQTSTSSPWIFIIDGLDECDGRIAQQEILRSIGNAFCEQSLPLKIIVASRPEPDIREVFEEPAFQGLHET
ncbi:hypothetical protein DFH06DRAFT_640155, partial [Mycena polygramma]